MREKPSIDDEKICACLRTHFGLDICLIEFLPLGGDLSSALYRTVAEDGMDYFCKLKLGRFDEISVELPRFLTERGLGQIIPPLVTRTGRLWAEEKEFCLILYPFVDGKSGFDVPMAETQWADFGSGLKEIHKTPLPDVLSRKIRRENFSAEWRDGCRTLFQRLDSEVYEDLISLQMAAYLAVKRDTILEILGFAEKLARTLAVHPPEFVLCHADIHPGNLFIDKRGALFIVDWDYPMFAPKERDLMMIGGGQGYVGGSAEEEELFFYRYYGQAPVDPIALAYYRCERNIIDLGVETSRILALTNSEAERSFSNQIIHWLFDPKGSIEMAYRAVARIP